VTIVLVVTIGAVSTPVVEMEPGPALELHVTAELKPPVPVTVAEH
jgi:hypothetical protein